MLSPAQRRIGAVQQGGVTVMAEIPRRMKRLIREHAAAAHEAELRRALLPLADAFKQWEQGAINSFSLQELIHQFHQGPARDIYVRYATNHREPALAYAIATGVIDRAAIPAELLDHLAGLIEFYQDLQAER